MDMVMIGEAIDRAADIAFCLKFDKARERAPQSREDFATVNITLQDDSWTCEQSKEQASKTSPVGKLWHAAFLDALATSDRPGRTTRTAWLAEAVRTGLAKEVSKDDTKATRDREMAKLRKYATELRLAGLIGIDGETVINLRKSG
jgi:hypothetical protein